MATPIIKTPLDPPSLPLWQSVPVAFGIGFVTDFVWAKLVVAIGAADAVEAANWSLALYLCGLFSTHWLIKENYGAVAALAAGSWLGTFFCVAGK